MSQYLINSYMVTAIGFEELSDTEWVCDIDQYHTGSNNNLCVEFISNGATPSYSGSYYGLGMFMQDNGAKYYNITTANNNGTRSEGAYPSGASGLNSYKGSVLYTRLTRLSATSFKTETFSDSSRSSSLGSSTLTVSADIKGLNQISFWANGDGGNYYYDNVEIWDGTTSTSGSSDYENDFASSTGWTQSGSSVTVNSAYSGAVGSTSTTGGDYVIRNFS